MGKRILIFVLSCYKRFVSPLLPGSCRFYPSCSQYIIEAVDKYGVGRGVWLGIKRLVRCHPFCPGGVDLVP